jgi:hypothetical protein
VTWNPDNENQLYAPPHPRCKLPLDRYRCGILMADWSFDASLKALRKAVDLYRGLERLLAFQRILYRLNIYEICSDSIG